jgi:superfamily II DNA or RNA helicase
MTNVKKKRIGFPRKLEEFEQFDICLVTSQMFISPRGKKLLNKIKKMFGVLLIDEVQTVGAPEMASVVSQLNVKYKIGVSGTPERKDGKEFIFYNLLGPVFYENFVERLRPTILVTPTALAGKLPQSWTYMVSKLEKDPARLKLIAETALEDVKNKHMVLIPMTRVPVINALVQAINQMAGKKIAGTFHGQMHKDKRKAMIDYAREYRCRILVGNSRLLSTGINIPRASMMYQCTPSANIPKAEQRFSRVLTPHDGKPDPCIRYFLDDVDVIRKCLQKEHWQCLVPSFRPKVSTKTALILKEYFAKKGKTYGRNDYAGGVY